MAWFGGGFNRNEGENLRDYDFENKITEGKIQKIENILFDFNKIFISFVNLFNGKRKLLAIHDVTSITLQPDYKETTDVMEYETLIGYDYLKKGHLYEHCLKTDTYEFIIMSYCEPKLTDLH